MRKITYDTLLKEAGVLFAGTDKEDNPEYLRGMAELIAGVCGIEGLESDVRASQIETEILLTNNKY